MNTENHNDKKVTIQTDGVRVTMEGPEDTGLSLPEVLNIFEDLVFAWGYRLKLSERIDVCSEENPDPLIVSSRRK